VCFEALVFRRNTRQHRATPAVLTCGPFARSSYRERYQDSPRMTAPMPSQSLTDVALVSVRFLTQFREKFRGCEASPVRRHVDRGCLCGWTDVRDLGAVLDHELPHSCARSGPVNQPLAGMVVGTRTDRLCGSDFNASGWPDLRWRPISGGVAPARGGGARHEWEAGNALDRRGIEKDRRQEI
jgi:hypothetical protein